MKIFEPYYIKLNPKFNIVDLPEYYKVLAAFTYKKGKYLFVKSSKWEGGDCTMYKDCPYYSKCAPYHRCINADRIINYHKIPKLEGILAVGE